MADLPNDEKAKKPIGTSVLLGLLVGIISHEIVYQYANSHLWFSLAGVIPGLYISRALIKSRLKAMHVIESDDLTIARKLQGKISYSESFANYCKLAFIACFDHHGRRQRAGSRISRSASINVYPHELMEFFHSDDVFHLSLARHCVDKEGIASWSSIDINYPLTTEPSVFSVDSESFSDESLNRHILEMLS